VVTTEQRGAFDRCKGIIGRAAVSLIAFGKLFGYIYTTEEVTIKFIPLTSVRPGSDHHMTVCSAALKSAIASSTTNDSTVAYPTTI
jgi:hypothetical protein